MAKKGEGSAAILDTLGDFTSKENWDNFFTLRGTGDSFEWYADWPSLRQPLLTQLSSATAPPPLQILVPGCGNSSLSEHLYDAGFPHITNIDFSKVVVSDMLRRHIRSRPEMRWRVMDMTDMQFADEFFSIVLDKGGLDALMEPELGSKLGSKYLKEVKRVLKSGGKFLCLTLAESHVLGLLFAEFRFGWETVIDAIPQKSRKKSTFETFMVSIVKEKLGAFNPIISSYDSTSVNYNTNQIHALVDAVENENKIRNEYASCNDIIHSLEDIQLGSKGNLKELSPGRRFRFILGEQGDSIYSYKAVLLDAHSQPDPFLYHYGVFIVPKARSHEWLFNSEEGQWLVVESSKSARLIMVFLDSRHSLADMEVIKKDLSPLVKDLTPGKNDDEAPIPFLTASDGVKERNVVRQVTSTITGPIIVDDVIYENADDEDTSNLPSETKMFRRLIFERSSGLVQSEAFLIRQESQSNFGEADSKRGNLPSKSSRKGGRRRKSESDKKVNYSCLASSYHSGIISGFSLIASTLKDAISSGRKVRTIVIGLGAGLLPMFLRGCLPSFDIDVVELDPIVFDLARDHFGFCEDKHLKVHIGDGIKFFQDGNRVKSSKVTVKHENQDSSLICLPCEEKSTNSVVNGSNNVGLNILIVDADASDPSSGLTCPPADFVEEPFLLTVKDLLSEGGLFVINLVSRSAVIRDMVVSRMKVVFNHLFSLGLEEDVNEVLFASMDECINADHFAEAVAQLQSLLKFPLPNIEVDAHNIKCLK